MICVIYQNDTVKTLESIMIQTLEEALKRIRELETENEGVISRRTAYRYKAYYDELKKTGERENGRKLKRGKICGEEST